MPASHVAEPGPLLHAVLSSGATPWVALFGTVATLLWNRWSAVKAERSSLLQKETTQRAIAYAEFRRVRRTTQGHLNFIREDIDSKAGMIWLSVFRSLLPSPQSFARIELLSAAEVRRITSFYYSYAESIAFIKSAAIELFPDYVDGKRRAPQFNLDMDVIEYIYDAGEDRAGRRRWIVEKLETIHVQASKALEEVERTQRRRFPFSELSNLMKSDRHEDRERERRRLAELSEARSADDRRTLDRRYCGSLEP